MYPDDQTYLRFLESYSANIAETRSFDILNGVTTLSFYTFVLDIALILGFVCFSILLPFIGWLVALPFIGVSIFIYTVFLPLNLFNALNLTIPNIVL